MGRPPDITEWYTAYANEVYTFLAYFYTSKDVDDLVQETFVRALHGLKGYNGTAAPKTWLMKIARNVAIDHLRKRRLRLEGDSLFDSLVDTDVPDCGRTPLEQVVERDELNRLLSYLASIKPAYRQVVILRSVMDYSIRETALILGWSQSRVGVTYHRAMNALREFLTETDEGGTTYGTPSP